MKNNNLGKAVFKEFKGKVETTSKWFDVASNEKLGSRLVVESPFVSKSFEDAGFKIRENAFGMNVFRPNIKMEDYAVVSGQISMLTLTTTQSRAEATTEHILRYPTVQAQIKKAGATEYDLYTCVFEAAVRELMQVSFVGNLEMSDKAKQAAAFAVIKRTALKNGKFRDSLEIAGVDWTWDVAASSQFAGEIDFEGFVQDLYRTDPYFNRRANIIDCARFETTAKSAEMPELASSTLVDKMLLHLVKKSKRLDSWLVHALDRAIG